MENESGPARKRSAMIWRALWTTILVGIVLFLALYDFEYFPATGFDEGTHLLVARRLALEGVYRFGPALGPTVFFPVAAAFRLAGVTLLSARVVMVGYLLLCVGAFYFLARHLGGWKVATVGTLLFVSSPGVNLLRWGRQTLGEVPAGLFFLLAAFLWARALEAEHKGRRRATLVLSGILLGLAIVTKNQFLLLLPAWFLLWITDRLYHRQANHLDFVLPGFCAVVCVAAWYVGQRFLLPAGEDLSTRNLQAWSSALSRGMFTFSPGRMLDSIKFLTDKDAFYAWVLPGWLYALVLSLRRTRDGLRWAFFVLVAAVWYGWFILLSVGWPRYAFLALTVTGFFVAQLFHDLTQGYRFPLRELWNKIRAGQWDLASAGRIGLMALLLVMLLRSLQGRFTALLMRDDTPQQIATYIVEHLPQGTEIETYDPEVCFLSGYDCHFPPTGTINAAIKYVWYDAPPPSQYYDFREHGAPYLLIGDFGRWVHVYDPEIVERDCDLVTSVGSYELYQVRQDNQ